MGIFDGILGPVFGAIGTAIGGPVGGSLGSALGSSIASSRQSDRLEDATQQQNAMNLDVMREQQGFNSAEAAKARDWQSGLFDRTLEFNTSQSQMNKDFQYAMSSTAYSRAVADMGRAGLNPMLAYSQGGASTPGGGAASVSTPASVNASSSAAAQMQNSKLAQVQTALQLAVTNAQIQKVQAETDESRSRALVNAAEVPKLEQDTKTSLHSAEHLKAQSIDLYERLRVKMPEEHARLASQTNLDNQRLRLTQAQEIHEYKRAGLTDAEVQVIMAELPRLRNQARAQDSWWMREVSPYVNDATKAIFSGASMGRAVGGIWRR